MPKIDILFKCPDTINNFLTNIQISRVIYVSVCGSDDRDNMDANEMRTHFIVTERGEWIRVWCMTLRVTSTMKFSHKHCLSTHRSSARARSAGSRDGARVQRSDIARNVITVRHIIITLIIYSTIQRRCGVRLTAVFYNLDDKENNDIITYCFDYFNSFFLFFYSDETYSRKAAVESTTTLYARARA